MSRRRSTGDLVPRDITEILAQEAKAQRGQRKPGHSLGLAFSWFKRSRRKKTFGNGGLNCSGPGATDTKVGLHNNDSAKAGPKGHDDQKRLSVHFTASQHLQENVFIEGSRPQYLEDLHTEAQEGLKIQQHEENKSELNTHDDDSITSADTLCPEQDDGSKDEDDPLDSTSTNGNNDTTVTSALSVRPVLTRQGSTFKPLNQVKRLDKNKKRSRRTTIMGIPNQVQKELALHRSSTFQPLVTQQFPYPDRESHLDGTVILPTDDEESLFAKKTGAKVHLSELEALRDDQHARRHFQERCQDEQSFNHQGFNLHLHPSSRMRPKSLAVPGMTTSSSSSSSMLSFLQEPQGPVMSVSPQATYLSTIIPNAVMPASVEVIKIDRSNRQSRGCSINQGTSVRTVSKSSLSSVESSVSPLLSRRFEDGSQNDSVLTVKSLSGSHWTESQSSKIIILNSSPLSSKSSTRSSNERYEQECQAVLTGADQVSVCDSLCLNNCSNENSVTRQGQVCSGLDSVATEESTKNKRNINRSLSVTKTKQPPAPPRRINSLHINKISNKTKGDSDAQGHTRDISYSPCVEATTDSGHILKEDDIKQVKTNTIHDIPPSTKPNTSTSSSTSLRHLVATTSGDGGVAQSNKNTSTGDGKFERTMSPSSGYSSQSGTPTLSPKEISPTSPNGQRATPSKPERSLCRVASTPGSPSHSLSSLSSGASEPTQPELSLCEPSLQTQGSPHKDTATELPLNHSLPFRQEIKELLNIPPPPRVKAPSPPVPETWAYNRHTLALLCRQPSNAMIASPQELQDSTEQKEANPTNAREEKHGGHLTPDIERPVLNQSEDKTKTMLETHSEGLNKELKQDKKLKQMSSLRQMLSEKDLDLQSGRGEGSVVNKALCPETLKKLPPPVMKKPTKLLQREETLTTQRTDTWSSSRPIQMFENPTQNDPGFTDDDKGEAPSEVTLSLQDANISSSPPSPPPASLPTPPQPRETPPPLVSSSLDDTIEKTQAGDSCWPPPPPPLESDLVFEETNEVDFPPPPPLFIADSVEDMCSIQESDLDQGSSLQCPNLLTGISEPAVTSDKALGVVQDLSSNSDNVEVSLQQQQQQQQNFNSVFDNISPPSVDSQTPPITRTEDLMSPSTSFGFPRQSFAEDQSLFPVPVIAEPPPTTAAPLLPAETTTHGVTFRRQPNAPHRDSRSKELLSRHKSAPVSKEDANIPLVTPSLLQMVRLRSVSMTEDQAQAASEVNKSSPEVAPAQESSQSPVQGSMNIPQKPIRKSLTLKSNSPALKTAAVPMSTPSMRLQEAIRMKTAAMSSRDILPSRMGVRPPSYCNQLAAPSPNPSEGYDMPSACSASFVFSKSTKRVVVEPATSSEAQALLRQSLASELMQVADQSKATSVSNGGVKWDRVPPPVAKKPAPSPNPSLSLAKVERGVEGNGECRQSSGITLPQTTTRVTEDTIETLF